MTTSNLPQKTTTLGLLGMLGLLGILVFSLYYIAVCTPFTSIRA